MKKIKTILKNLPLLKLLIQKRRANFIKKSIHELKETGTLLNTLKGDAKKFWKQRIDLILESSDNNKIKHHPNAGKFNQKNQLIMHNGLVIDPLSYYGLPTLEALYKNKAVHEPQEEYAFQEVLKTIPESGTMVELGAYWAFYSMWFNTKVKNAKNYMIEPENLDSGIKNFQLNHMKGDFTKAYISELSKYSDNEIPTVSVDDFVKDKNIEFIDILHSDIQGFELLMLKGAKNSITQKNVGYIFISTHSQELHYDCMDFLKSQKYQLLCSADLNESYSWDGLLVFKNPNYKGLNKIDISLRK